MIGKDDLESIFSQYYVIDPPKHVLVLDKLTTSINGQGMRSLRQKHGPGLLFYRGLQPSWRKDMIIITPQGNDETVIHETLHAQKMFREPLANLGGKTLVLKYRLLKRNGKLRIAGRFFGRKSRPIQYEGCFGCPICTPVYDASRQRNYILDMISVPKGADSSHFVRIG